MSQAPGFAGSRSSLSSLASGAGAPAQPPYIPGAAYDKPFNRIKAEDAFMTTPERQSDPYSFFNLEFIIVS